MIKFVLERMIGTIAERSTLIFFFKYTRHVKPPESNTASGVIKQKVLKKSKIRVKTTTLAWEFLSARWNEWKIIVKSRLFVFSY